MRLINRLSIPLSALVLLLFASHTHAQTLARPGWVGSGLTAQSWSKRAVLYEIDTRSFSDSNGDGVGDLKGIAERLDYLKSLGVDAILLEPLGPANSAPLQPGTQPVLIDPAIGTMDDFDDLTMQASRHGVRVLLNLPSPDPALARFWLTRGVAGFHVSAADTNPAGLQAIRKLLAANVGQRVLITDADLPAPPAAPAKQAVPQLLFDNSILKLPAPSGPTEAAQLRAALERTQALLRTSTPIIATDALALPRSLNRFAAANPGSEHDANLAKIMATVLLLNRSVAMLFSGQELGLSSPTGAPAMILWGKPATPPPSPDTPAPAPVKPPPPPTPDAYVPYVRPVVPPKPIPPDPASAAGQDIDPNSLLNFHRQLSQLHRGTTALHDGEEIFLNHDDENALVWVRKPATPSLQNPAVVIICNLSGKPLTLSLRPELTRLRLRGNFLRKILRSDDALGSVGVDTMTLPPLSVYIGELRL